MCYDFHYKFKLKAPSNIQTLDKLVKNNLKNPSLPVSDLLVFHYAGKSSQKLIFKGSTKKTKLNNQLNVYFHIVKSMTIHKKNKKQVMPSKIGSIMMITINSHRVLTSTILLSITYIFIATNVLGMYTGDE